MKQWIVVLAAVGEGEGTNGSDGSRRGSGTQAGQCDTRAVEEQGVG